MTSQPDDGSHRVGVFRRILVGFDGSAEAQHALGVAAALAAEIDGDVHVLLVVRPPAHTETTEDLHRATEAERDHLSHGLTQVEGLSQHHSRLTNDVTVADDPAAAIAAYAEEHGFDLVVVGNHGRGQATHRGVGHEVTALLRHHPCPVLVV